jgi:hypothetical protein
MKMLPTLCGHLGLSDANARDRVERHDMKGFSAAFDLKK